MNKKNSRKGNWGRDMFGNVINRAKSWGQKVGKCPKEDRRTSKTSMSKST